MLTQDKMARALQKAYPGKQWTLNTIEDGQELIWHDTGTAPTLSEIETAYNLHKAEFDAEDSKRAAVKQFSQKYDYPDIIKALKGNNALIQDMRAFLISVGL